MCGPSADKIPGACPRNQHPATKVSVQLIATDESLPLKERMLNKAERDGLYEALAIASIWLDRHNK